MFTIIFSKKSAKSLKKIEKAYKKKIKEILEKVEMDPFLVDIKKLSDDHRTTHRIRVGYYRVFIRLDQTAKEIFIIDIRRRTSTTYR